METEGLLHRFLRTQFSDTAGQNQAQKRNEIERIRITLRFYKGLNAFLSFAQRYRCLNHQVNGHPAVKDTIESLGVPHVEVGYIFINNRPVRFYARLKEGDRIAIYPVTQNAPTSYSIALKPKPLAIPKFVLDSHLGKLARHLRLLGFDTLYRNDFTDEEIVAVVRKHKRIVLTRDIGLLKNKTVRYGYWVRSTNSLKQIHEVIKRFKLKEKIKSFTRCLECNGKIIRIPKTKVIEVLPAQVRKYYDEFFRCCDCDKVYWQGSHYERLSKLTERLS